MSIQYPANPQPLGCKYPPITTRLDLPPITILFNHTLRKCSKLAIGMLLRKSYLIGLEFFP